MSKMREAFEAWWMLQSKMPYRSPEEIAWMGYQAAIAAVQEGGAIAWQNMRNGFICKERSAEYQHPLYKLPED